LSSQKLKTLGPKTREESEAPAIQRFGPNEVAQLTKMPQSQAPTAAPLTNTQSTTVVSLPNLAPGQHQLSRQTMKEPEVEQFRPETVEDFDPREVAEALQANPDIAQELARQIENDPSLAEVFVPWLR